MNIDPNDVKTRVGLAAKREGSLIEAVRTIANRTNEHAVLLMALMKHLNVTPSDLMKQVSEGDVVDVDQPPTPSASTIISTEN